MLYKKDKLYDYSPILHTTISSFFPMNNNRFFILNEKEQPKYLYNLSKFRPTLVIITYNTSCKW